MYEKQGKGTEKTSMELKKGMLRAPKRKTFQSKFNSE